MESSEPKANLKLVNDVIGRARETSLINLPRRDSFFPETPSKKNLPIETVMSVKLSQPETQSFRGRVQECYDTLDLRRLSSLSEETQ